MEEYEAAEAAGPPNPSPELQREAKSDATEYGPNIPFNISEGLITGCSVCNKQTNLSRCAACKVVQYCGPEPQIADRPAHKDFCKGIKKILFVLGKDEEAPRAHPGDVDTPPDAFDTAVGKFWRYKGTRNYMRSRYELILEIRRINTEAAVTGSTGPQLGSHAA